ncbi:MAG: GIY-YIG nuclease family protein [Candidatus Thorarchaeota archaeon]
MYYTYVLYSVEYDRIYIGQSDDLISRLERHNKGIVKSTKGFKPWKMIYHEKFQNRREAMKREKELKSHKRTRLDSRKIIE